MVSLLRIENLTMHGQTTTVRTKVKMLRKKSFLATANERALARPSSAQGKPSCGDVAQHFFSALVLLTFYDSLKFAQRAAVVS
jgi:hypothetical protein